MLQQRNLPFYAIAALLFGVKTYFVYRFIFNLSIENPLQELILAVNPFATSFLFFTFAALFKPERQIKFTRRISLIGTLILYFNVLYYRAFTDFITLPVLFQSSNVGDLGSSILSLLYATDLLIFADVLIVYYLSRKAKTSMQITSRKAKLSATALAFALLVGNVVLAEIERPMLFMRTFDREYLVKNIGIFNYHIYDAALQSKTKAQRVFADGSEMSEIEDYVENEVKSKESSKLEGIAKGKNVIYISAESLQSFVIDEKLNGKEITPFLNDLIDDSYYFENFYHQTEQGKTSDSEFVVGNSLYPLSRGAVFFTNAQNEYNAVPEIIGEYGYTSAVLHANNGSFWNRNVMYDQMGYDHFFDEQYYDVTKQNSIGWGLNDKAFFKQSIKYLENMKEPYYAKFITLTNHFPFELPEEEQNIDKYDSNSKTLNQYFTTVRYMDESIEQFFQHLKDSGEYKDSIIVIYGDHYGISQYHDASTSKFIGKDIRPYEHTQLQRVPFIVHIPGHEDDRVISKPTGQIDVKPTILSMLGIENKQDIQFGTDMFTNDKDPFVVLRDGSFISEDYLYAKNVCYDRETGEEIKSQKCEPLKKKAKKELDYSDSIIYGDLFRFYDFEHNQMDLSQEEES